MSPILFKPMLSLCNPLLYLCPIIPAKAHKLDVLPTTPPGGNFQNVVQVKVGRHKDYRGSQLKALLSHPEKIEYRSWCTCSKDPRGQRSRGQNWPKASLSWQNHGFASLPFPPPAPQKSRLKKKTGGLQKTAILRSMAPSNPPKTLQKQQHRAAAASLARLWAQKQV